MAFQVKTSLTSQFKQRNAKHNIRNEGKAIKRVITMYKTSMTALVGMANKYNTIKRIMKNNRNLVVKLTKKTSDLRREEWNLLWFRS